MRALSVLQPWAWAIAAGMKPIENREWFPPKDVVGTRIAIHASKKKVSTDDRAIFEEMLDEFGLAGPVWESLPYGAVVAVATVRGFVDVAGAKTLPRKDYRWFNGPFGWLLVDVVRLAEPVSAKGMLGLWPMPVDVETAVLQQVGRALADTLPPPAALTPKERLEAMQRIENVDVGTENLGDLTGTKFGEQLARHAAKKGKRR